MFVLRNKPLWCAIVSACAGVVVALAVLLGSGRAAEASSSQSESPPVALAALANTKALTRAPIATAEQAAGFQKQIGDLTPPPHGLVEWATGDLIPSKARILMSEVGSAHGTIYAIPTSKGRICSGLTGYSSGCTDGFRDESGDVTTTFGGGIVWGLAPNQVTAIEVVVDGVSHAARLENNAYFYEGGNPQQLIAHFQDGTRKTVNFPTPLPSAG
jgi:hypothetical protein